MPSSPNPNNSLNLMHFPHGQLATQDELKIQILIQYSPVYKQSMAYFPQGAKT